VAKRIVSYSAPRSIQEWLWLVRDDRTLSGTEKSILFAMASRYPNIHPGYEELARDSGNNKRTVMDGINGAARKSKSYPEGKYNPGLIDKGYVQLHWKDDQRVPGGRGLANIYDLSKPEDVVIVRHPDSGHYLKAVRKSELHSWFPDDELEDETENHERRSPFRPETMNGAHKTMNGVHQTMSGVHPKTQIDTSKKQSNCNNSPRGASPLGESAEEEEEPLEDARDFLASLGAFPLDSASDSEPLTETVPEPQTETVPQAPYAWKQTLETSPNFGRVRRAGRSKAKPGEKPATQQEYCAYMARLTRSAEANERQAQELARHPSAALIGTRAKPAFDG
jgi:hypothetical protein